MIFLQETAQEAVEEAFSEADVPRYEGLSSDNYHMSVVAPKAEKLVLRDLSNALAHEQKAIKAIGGKALGMHYNLEDVMEAVVVWYFQGKVPDIEPNSGAREVLRNGEVKGYTLRVFDDLIEADRFRRTSRSEYLKELEHITEKDGTKKKAFIFLL